MDLRQIVRTVRAHWIVALVTFLVCVGIGFFYVVLPAKQYQASVVLVAQPPPAATDSAADVGAIQIEIPQIVVEANNPVTQSESKAQVPARYQSVPVKITATGDPGSNSVTIKATSTDPAAAQAYMTKESDTVVCTVSFKGSFAAGQVEMAPPGQAGDYAVVLLTSRHLHLVGASVLGHLPGSLGKRAV